MKTTKVIVIGGGPAGLYAANLFETRKIPYILFEATDTLGGQPTTLYPAKDVVDIPLFPPMKAGEISATLIHGIDLRNVKMEEAGKELKETIDGVLFTTTKGEYKAEYAIIATGLGFHKPRTMGLENEESCSNILYSLLDPETMKGKNVVIFGGGDSALDWAKQLSTIASKTYLVHRRNEFRGNAETINGCNIIIEKPFIPAKITYKDGKCVSIAIEGVEDKSIIDIPCDYVLVNYGQVPAPSTFGYELTTKGFGLLTKEDYSLSKRIFACGDCIYDPNRKKRIAPAMEEADIILKSILGNR